MMLHATGALMLQSPTLQLQQEEGKLLAERLCDLADYYKVDLSGERTGPYMVWIGFIGAVTTVYGRKLIMIKHQRAQALAGADQPATVSPGMGVRKPMDFGSDNVVSMQ